VIILVNHIGKKPIGYIQSIQFDSGESLEEIDLINKDANLIFTDVNEGKNIEIEFILTEKNHPENLIIEEQRKEIKSLVSEDYLNNTFRKSGIEGRISISSVDVSENADLDTIREGSIQGTFLPWPKYETANEPKFYKVISGEILAQLNLDGDVDSFAFINPQKLNLNLDTDLTISFHEYTSGSLNFNFVTYEGKTGFGNNFGNNFVYENVKIDLYASGEYGVGNYGSGTYNE